MLSELISLNASYYGLQRGTEYRSRLNIYWFHLSYRKKSEEFLVKYGTWQMILRSDRRGHFGDSQWAEISVGWKSAGEFLITVSGGFRKGPPCPAGTPQHFSV